MATPRIRWEKVARLAGAALACALSAAVLPRVLRVPAPPPLPPDVGLAAITPPVASAIHVRTADRASRPAPRRKVEAPERSRSPANRAAPSAPAPVVVATPAEAPVYAGVATTPPPTATPARTAGEGSGHTTGGGRPEFGFEH